MVKTVRQDDTVLHQCDECGLHYAEKEVALKCEAWCKEHKSCNLEITSHAVQNGEERLQEAIGHAHAGQQDTTRFNTRLFYGLIGVTASLAFLLVLYWGLRLDSTIDMLIVNTYGKPLYFWPYVTLTFAAILLFGI